MNLKNVYEQNTPLKILISLIKRKNITSDSLITKKFETYLVKYDLKNNFDGKFTPPVKFELQNNLTFFHLKGFCYFGLIFS